MHIAWYNVGVTFRKSQPNTMNTNHSTLRQGSGTIAVSSDHSDTATRRVELLEVLIMLLKGLVESLTMTAVQLVLQIVVSRSYSNIKRLP